MSVCDVLIRENTMKRLVFMTRERWEKAVEASKREGGMPHMLLLHDQPHIDCR